jgi:starch synthase
LTSNYDQKSLNKRHFNKISLEQHFGLDRDDSILHGVVTRLSWQKGIDFIIQSLDEIISNGARLILVGQGDIGMERSLKEASERYKGRLGIFMGYDENLAHKLLIMKSDINEECKEIVG